jgi:hypothetical protein
MWTGGKPPRIPIVTPTRTVPPVKNGRVDAELAALKQRGLAKILNKHFTETAAKLAAEKAAADAACRDLEERKARTSEFKESGNIGLSPLDEACIKANQWRAECRRKERETLLLYQRYVSKYGDAVMNVAKLSDPVDTKRTSAPPPNRLPPLVPSPMGTLVPSMAAQIETTLEEYLKQGGLAHPSVITHGKEMTLASAAAKEEAAFRDHYRRLLEQRGVDAVCGPGYYKASEHGEVDIFTRTVGQEQLDAAVKAGMMALENLPLQNIHGRIDSANDDDNASVVSGLTTLHSAMTRELLQDCERSVQTFLRDEQAHIRQIIEEEGSSYDDDDHTAMAVKDAKKTAKEAESMVQQMQDILLEYQKKHAEKDPDVTAKKPVPFPTDNEDEEWVVYYDEFYQQEYYHEIKSNRTQWEPPGRDSSGSLSTDVFSVLNEYGADSSGDFDTRSVSSSSNRVAAYRRKRRQQRRRRRILLAFVSIVAAVVGFAYYQCELQNNPHCTTIQHEIMEQWKDLKSGGEYKKSLLAAAEAERQRLLELELQRQQEATAAAVAAEAERLLREAEEAARLAREEAEYRALMKRPWACNLPFAYLFHARCRRLASQNPLFDLQALIQSMLQ